MLKLTHYSLDNIKFVFYLILNILSFKFFISPFNYSSFYYNSFISYPINLLILSYTSSLVIGLPWSFKSNLTLFES
jgi:hypothetical protein